MTGRTAPGGGDQTRAPRDPQLGFEFEPASSHRASIPASDPLQTAPYLIRELVRLQEEDPLSRKVLIGRTRGGVRELLRQVARVGGQWSGFESTTIHPVALEIAAHSLARSGLRLIDEFDARALVDRAIDEVMSRGDYGRLGELADAVGLRERIYGAVMALRLAGLAPGRVGASSIADDARRTALTRILDSYERGLADTGAADPATVLGRAAELVQGGAWEPDPHTSFHLLPELSTIGLAGRLLSALEAAGATRIPTDPVMGLTVPHSRLWAAGETMAPGSGLYAPTTWAAHPHVGTLELDLYAGAGVAQELREALRRVVESGHRWDEVEIVTPDPGVYGSALHSICERAGIPVTFGVGLPLSRTRPGRAVLQYFRWIEGGFSATDLRVLLEKGDLRPGGRHRGIGEMRLARRFRRLRVGWGRERYTRLLNEALEGVEDLPRRHWESEEDVRRRRARALVELQALRSILVPVLRATPVVPHPRTGGGIPVSAAELATGLQAFLKFVPAEHSVDATAKEKVLAVLARVVETLTRKTEYAWAAASLHHHLDLRVPAPRAEGKAPWSSDGGSLFLTDIEHGGRTGRAVTFIVGLDAGRFPGGGLEDPLLLDRDRIRFGKSVLPTAAERLAERRFEFAALFARLRGRVTVSYAAWEPAEARALAPAAEMLQVLRLRAGDSALTFQDLHAHVGPARGVLARTTALDAEDVWMRSLAPEGTPLRGTSLVRTVFPGLDRGLRYLEALDLSDASPWVGMIDAHPELDPRLNPERVLSASRLESLGRCPRRYFFQSVLKVRTPDDFVMDPDLWLDALVRGRVLHTLYERALKEARIRNIAYADDAFAVLVQTILAEEIEQARALYPVPSPLVAEREIKRLEGDAASFVAMIREYGADWLGLEVRFGFDDTPAIRMPVPGGEIALRGIVDRVDRGDEHGLRVVDYKTGSLFGFGAHTGVFNRGRRLQHLVYVAAAGRLFDRPVAAMEYHFPTRRAENRVIGFPEPSLRCGPEVLGHLLDGVREGAFLPTDDPSDCGYCDFQGICRVRENVWGDPSSPLAEWARRHADQVEEFRWTADARRAAEEGEGIPGFHARVDGQKA